MPRVSRSCCSFSAGGSTPLNSARKDTVAQRILFTHYDCVLHTLSATRWFKLRLPLVKTIEHGRLFRSVWPLLKHWKNIQTSASSSIPAGATSCGTNSSQTC